MKVVAFQLPELWRTVRKTCARNELLRFMRVQSLSIIILRLIGLALTAEVCACFCSFASELAYL